MPNILGLGSLPDRFKPRRSIDLSEPAIEYADPSLSEGVRGTAAPALCVVIAPIISPERSLEVYREFVSYLAGRLSRRPVFLQRQSYTEVNDLVRYDFADLALVCTYALIRGEKEFGMELLVVPQIRGAITYRSYIITAQTSTVGSLDELGGKSFASCDLMSSSGWLYPATWLIEHGKNPRSFFSRHMITGSHDRSIIAVATGLAEAAAVDSLVYDQMKVEDPTLAARTRIIQESPPFGMLPVVVSPRIDPTLKRTLYSILVTMHEDEVGSRLLRGLGFDRFIKPDPRLYDEVRRMATIWEAYE